MFNYEFKNNNIYITGIKEFDLAQTLDCGQAFRWEEKGNGIWCGVALNKYIEIEKLSDGTIILYNTTEEDFNNLWCNYFDLKRDYNEIITAISSTTSWQRVLPATTGAPHWI
jgi:N-glycosylase/DNA lyase